MLPAGCSKNYIETGAYVKKLSDIFKIRVSRFGTLPCMTDVFLSRIPPVNCPNPNPHHHLGTLYIPYRTTGYPSYLELVNRFACFGHLLLAISI